MLISSMASSRCWRVGARVALAAAGDQRVEDVVEHRLARPRSRASISVCCIAPIASAVETPASPLRRTSSARR
jgi:hypothetical protein